MQFLNIDVWEIVKWFVVFGELLYLVFALVIVKQVRVMLETLEIGFGQPIRFLAFGHLVFALGVIIMSLVML